MYRCWILGLVIALGTNLYADGAGVWNLPSRLPQCMGLGFGPGYHAPIIIGPRWRATVEDPGVVRLPYAPAAPPASRHGFGGMGTLHSTPPVSYTPPAYHAAPAYAAPPAPAYYAPARVSAPLFEAEPAEPASPSDDSRGPQPEPLATPDADA